MVAAAVELRQHADVDRAGVARAVVVDVADVPDPGERVERVDVDAADGGLGARAAEGACDRDHGGERERGGADGDAGAGQFPRGTRGGSRSCASEPDRPKEQGDAEFATSELWGDEGYADCCPRRTEEITALVVLHGGGALLGLYLSFRFLAVMYSLSRLSLCMPPSCITG